MNRVEAQNRKGVLCVFASLRETSKFTVNHNPKTTQSHGAEAYWLQWNIPLFF